MYQKRKGSFYLVKLRIQSMLSDWLSVLKRNPSPYNRFDVFDISEKKSKDSSVKNDLKNTFDKHTVNIELVKFVARKIGWEKAYEYLGTSMQPTKLEMKKGRFGEIILAGILEELFDYVIPIHKLKYSFTRKLSLPSTDLLAVKMSEDGVNEMCFIESKLRTKKNNDTVVKGYDQLMKDQTGEIPEILTFIMQRLHEKNDPILSRFVDYCLITRFNQNRDTFRIGAIFDDDKWDEKNLEKLQEQTDAEGQQRKITVDVVRIKELEKFIIDFYSHIGVKPIV